MDVAIRIKLRASTPRAIHPLTNLFSATPAAAAKRPIRAKLGIKWIISESKEPDIIFGN